MWYDPVNTIVGSVYTQYDTIGYASYHFNTVYDCYISYTNSEWKLDSGEKFPDKKQFINVRIDEKKKTFTGEISWEPNSHNGNVRWFYEMMFSKDMSRIESGGYTCYDNEGKVTAKYLYGKDLKYRRSQG